MDERAVVTAAEVARLAGVGRAAVSNWRRRYRDFPQPVGGSDSSPSFRLTHVWSWLRANGRLGAHSLLELAWQALETAGRPMAEAVAVVGTYLASGAGNLYDGVRGPVEDLAAEVGSEAAFEQLCARYVEAWSRQLAVTPAELASLMIELANVGAGPVLDPACGTGSLLRAAPRGVEVLGQDLDTGLAALARARLAFTHPMTLVAEGDSLRADAYSGVQASAVVCNPPFNERAWGYEELQFDRRWIYGLPPKGESELAWVQHCLAHLRPDGHVVIVLPPGVASRRPGRAIRAALLRRGVVRAVISLPPGAVAPAHLPMHLWVLSAEGDPTEGVRLIDTSRGSQARLDDLGWPEVGRRVHRAMAGAADPDLHRLVRTIDLLDADVDLTPARHLRVDPDLADLDADRARFRTIWASLGDLLPDAGHVSEPAERPRTTIGELAKHGALTIHQQVGPMEIGSGLDMPVLTSSDVAEGHAPSGSVSGVVDGVRLRPGDIVVPTVASIPTAVVVDTTTDALLGPGLQLLRPDPERLDPWFLAGVLRSDETTRVATTKSGSYRVEVRRVELLRLPLAEQRRLGAAFRALDRFAAALDEAAELGRRLEHTLTEGLVSGRLQPEERNP